MNSSIDCQALQRLPVRARIEHEVVRPDVIRPPSRREAAADPLRHASPRPSTRHLQPCATPDAMGTIGAHRHATPRQEHRGFADNRSAGTAPASSRIAASTGASRFASTRLVPQRRTRHREQRARSPRRARPRLARTRPARRRTRGAHHFFRATSRITSISRSRSATSFFSSTVLLLELPQPLHVHGLELAEPLAPGVDRLVADAVPLRDLRHRAPIRLAQDLHHLLFA